MRAHVGRSTEVVDGRGVALVPGLVDSHIHPFHGTDGTRGADLNGLRTLDEVRGALAAERALRARRLAARLGPVLRQALTALQALEGYTTEAARAVGEERLGGRIAPGLRADLTRLGADPVDCPADELPDVPVRLTVVDGEIAFRGD